MEFPKENTILEAERLCLTEVNQEDFNSLCEILQDEDTVYAYEGAFNDRAYIKKAIKFYSGLHDKLPELE